MLHRVPDLSDTNYMLQILMYLGAHVERASGTVTVQAEKVNSVAPYDVVRQMRASVCVLGPLLARCREATVSLPGGCVIGDRPIDLHLMGFEALGAAVRVEGGNVRMFTNQLQGAVINLRGKFGPTVLGTDNVMMAAVLAEGTTVIEGAASEPEVCRSGGFPEQDGREDRGRGHAAFDHRGCEGIARRGARHYSRSNRDRHVSRRRRDLRQGRDGDPRQRRARECRDQRVDGSRIQNRNQRRLHHGLAQRRDPSRWNWPRSRIRDFPPTCRRRCARCFRPRRESA